MDKALTTSVGWRSLQVMDKDGAFFSLFLMYPTDRPAQPVAFGPYTMSVSPDAPFRGQNLPLVVLSHGGGGSYLVYRTLAHYLARHGYVIAMPLHPGDNLQDHSRSDTVQNLADRPRHAKLAIDAVAADPMCRDAVRMDQVAFIGHSMGGYTALAVAGAQPWAGFHQKIEVVQDPRVRALVLMAPTTGWFVPNDSLKGVSSRILLLVAEHDEVTLRWNAQLILDQLPRPGQVTMRIIANAGHFSFLSPFHPSMKRRNFPPAWDPEGFDRERFQDDLNAQILAFLREP